MNPNHTAVRVALWRALHGEVDASPLVLDDRIGALLVGDLNWRLRPDMNIEFSKSMRASIVGRTRYVEDLVKEFYQNGGRQYIILGAGLDTFSLRHSKSFPDLKVFEIEDKATQDWKLHRITELKIDIPRHLKFVPVNFEDQESWWDKAIEAGFSTKEPVFVSSMGVSMYLSAEANKSVLLQIQKAAPASVYAMSFLLKPELLNSPTEKAALEFVIERAKGAGTPFLSLFSIGEVQNLAASCGYKNPTCILAKDIYLKYFSNRVDGLSAGEAENILICKT